MATLALDKPDALMRVGFGLGIIGMNAAPGAIGWMPPRYTTTAFEFAATSEWWVPAAGGLDRTRPVRRAQHHRTGLLDRFERRYGHRPAYFFRCTPTTSGG